MHKSKRVHNWTAVQRYGLSVAVFVVTLSASLALSYFEYKINLTIPILAGLFAVAWFGGRGPGLLLASFILIATAWRNQIPAETSIPTLIVAYASAFGLLALLVVLISGRRVTSAANKRLRRQNEMLLNSVGEGIIAIDRDGRCTFSNPAAARSVGWEMDELVGRSLHNLLHHTGADGNPYLPENCPIGETLKTGNERHISGELFWKKNGESFVVEYTSTPLFENDRVSGAVVVFRDITREKKAQDELLQKGLLIEQSHEAILVWDFEHGILNWNSGSELLYGYGRTEALGRVSYEMLQTVFPMPVDQFLELLKSNGYWAGDVVQRTKEGREVFSSSRYQIVKLDGRDIVLQTNRDITDRKRAEQELRRLNETLEKRVAERTQLLEAANNELEAFSYSVSHDLRAPLRAVDGFSRIVIEDYSSRLDAEGVRLLNVIRSSAQNMGHLIDDLLQFSRLSRKPLETSPLNVQSLAQDVSRDFQNVGDPRPAEFMIGDLPEVHGDRSLLRQVFVNLFSNAIKYSKESERVEVEVGGFSKNGENIYFVRDHGIGFDMKYASKIFGVFQRLHDAEQFEGTGVGLAIVHRIVSRHGGRVWAEAELNRGATFFFSLPRAEPYRRNNGK
jgi:PAS domain S-box-containing protein